MTNIDKNKLYDGVLGLAIGDALGVPAEFMSREQLQYKPITDMLSGGAWNQPAGTWSDDTAMTLATIDALNKCNWEYSKLLCDIIMLNFELWYKTGKFAACGNRFDIGETCRKAIEHYIEYSNPENCGLGKYNYGNGALMRILPVVFSNKNPIPILQVSRLTHNNKVCDFASLIYTDLIKELLVDTEKEMAFEYVQDRFRGRRDISIEFSRLLNQNFSKLDEEEVKSSGYVIDTLEAAIWCFLNTNNYIDCVLTAVNLGDDTDTVAAVAGGLAGIYYGINENNGIPEKWINKLRDLKSLQKIVNAVYD